VSKKLVNLNVLIFNQFFLMVFFQQNSLNSTSFTILTMKNPYLTEPTVTKQFSIAASTLLTAKLPKNGNRRGKHCLKVNPGK
jgi:hypothetical protein